MDIEEKFESGKIGRTYRRVDPDYKVDIFLGYNDDGQMSMVIAEPGKETSVKSSKYINASLKRREDGKLSLAFDLTDDSYKTMFMLFCKDVIVVCDKAGPDMAISSASRRWKYWKNLIVHLFILFNKNKFIDVYIFHIKSLFLTFYIK